MGKRDGSGVIEEGEAGAAHGVTLAAPGSAAIGR